MFLFWNSETDMRLAIEAKSEKEAKRLAEQTLKSTENWILESRG